MLGKDNEGRGCNFKKFSVFEFEILIIISSFREYVVLDIYF